MLQRMLRALASRIVDLLRESLCRELELAEKRLSQKIDSLSSQTKQLQKEVKASKNPSTVDRSNNS